jgi:hypothetical protein
MSCCGEKNFGNQLYKPLNRRLLDFGTDSTQKELLDQFPDTHIWLFSFFDKADLECQDCTSKLKSMVSWVEKYGLLSNPVRNMKWIVEEDIKNNFIAKEIGLSKSPTHLICNREGNIIDIIAGFPDDKWLEKNILPLVGIQ